MNSKLYQQAIQNVDNRRKQELFQEIEDEIQDEYHLLKFESEKITADAATREKIRSLHRQCRRLPTIQMYDAPHISKQVRILENYVKTGKYHPRELKELEEFVQHRLDLQKKKEKR